jgi:two-component sensor histidine kinase
MLAVVQSIVTNSLLHSRDIDGAKDAIVGRLHALASAQDFVVLGNSGGVPIRDLLECELMAFATRTHMSGVPLVLGSAFAQQFALVIHELATNAVKYGSLSTPRGNLVLAWDIEEAGDEPVLRFSWKERGGPPAVTPVQRGFGSELIATTLSRAPTVSFGADGFLYAVEVPLSEVMRAAN